MSLDKRSILQRVERGELEVEQAIALLSGLAHEGDGTGGVRQGLDSAGGGAETVYYEPFWEPLEGGAAPRLSPSSCVLVLGEVPGGAPPPETELGGAVVVLVQPGEGFSRRGQRAYEVDLTVESSVERLLLELERDGLVPRHIAHLWPERPAGSAGELWAGLSAGLDPLFLVVKQLLQRGLKGMAKAEPRPRLTGTAKADPRPTSTETANLAVVSVASSGQAALSRAAAAGFLHVAAHESPRLGFRAVQIDGGSQSPLAIALRELALPGPERGEIKYVGRERWIRRIRKVEGLKASGATWFRRGGVYLITGGAGGLGLILAEHLARTAGARLVLMGRSRLSGPIERALGRIAANGAEVVYEQGDVGSLEDVRRAVRRAEERFGGLNGVIHAAGVIEDAFVAKKPLSSFQRVLTPKILGALHLDEATRKHDLDVFLLFSSLATMLGEAGQCDYAAANRFLEELAVERSGWVAAGRRAGLTQAISWPLWAGGGMDISEVDKAELWKRAGMSPLGPREGLAALETALHARRPHLFVVRGEPARIAAAIEARIAERTARRSDGGETPPIDRASLEDRAEGLLLDVISHETKVARSRIHPQHGLDALGIDSMLIKRLNLVLEDHFGPLSKTLFFEHQTVRELARYFTEHHPERLASVTRDAGDVRGMAREAATQADAAQDPGDRACAACAAHAAEPRAPEQAAAREGRPLPGRAAPTSGDEDDIAIIGVSGRYPGAADLDELWDNLRSGRDCVTTVPEDRWDHARYYDPDKRSQGTSYGRWGGFLAGVDGFDPLFFNIAPREAETMDPQERLFLQVAWSAVEDAGYSRRELAAMSVDGEQGAVGVFVGVTSGQYQLIGAEEWGKGNRITPSSSFWSIANRVSYTLNLHGPSMPVDTACSASLTALHLACESLRRGECQAAIVGGVNLNIHPSKYVALSQLKFLSSDGRCRSFGEGGDGYVPGEGVGAVVLKPLRRAIDDGDSIYAVIKATTINHGGKTNGYTVPNPNAHARLIHRALRRAKVDPRTIGYVEAHGTGTALGDPVEIAGLQRAFEAYTSDRQFCAIGSIKSNLGHLESAAGIASLTKVILQLKHRQLAPSLHAEVLNENIDFPASAFHVQRQAAPWPEPVTQEAGERRPSPRRAAISSFGAGGANAHAIIEEYLPPHDPRAEVVSPGAQLVVLSAKTEERLRAYAAKLHGALSSALASGAPAPALQDVAFTLQVGREELESRLAVVAGSLEDLLGRLSDYLAGRAHPAIWAARVAEETMAPDAGKDGHGERDIAALLRDGRWAEIAALWVIGRAIPWEAARRGQRWRRVALPTYPFEHKRFWVHTTGRPAAEVTPRAPHPLVDRVIPSLHAATFEKVLNRQDRLLQDHRVRGNLVCPGVAHLEMVRAAADMLGRGTARRLRNVAWLAPIVVTGETLAVQVTLEERESGLHFNVKSEGAAGAEVHSSGQVVLEAPDARRDAPAIDLGAVRARCRQHLDKERLYAEARAAGLDYGSSFQCLEELWYGDGEALGELQASPELAGELDAFALHPALTDSALHVLRGLALDTSLRSENTTLVPFSVGEVEILAPLTARCTVYARLLRRQPEQGMALFDVTVLDDAGRSVLRLSELCARRLRPVERDAPPAVPAVDDASLFYRLRWTPRPLPARADEAPDGEGTVVIFTHQADFGLGQRLADFYGERRTILVELGEARATRGPGRICIDLRRAEEFERALQQAPALSRVFFLGGLEERYYSANDLDFLERTQERGVLSLFRLAKAMAAAPARRARLKVVTNDVYRVGDDDRAHHPFAGSLVGLTKVLARELPLGGVSYVDIAGADVAPPQDDAAWRRLLQALDAEHASAPEAEVALRGGRRFVRVVEPAVLPEAERDALPFKRGGVYLIVGGAGGIGMAVSRYLAREHEARLVLVGRRPRTDAMARAQEEIEALGGQALYLQGDISDLADMRAVVALARQTFGAIDGVIHSAIVLRDGTVSRMDEETFRAVLAPKVKGAVVLHSALEPEPLDFMAFFSSAISVTGAPGQGNYAAASTFEDCFALFLAHRMKRPVKLFNWGFWGDTGVVATEEYRKRLARQGVAELREGEGIEAFRKVMGARATQIMPMKMRPDAAAALGIDTTATYTCQPALSPSLIEPVSARVRGAQPDASSPGPGVDALDAMERFARLALLDAFQRMGALGRPGERETLAGSRDRLGVVPEQARLYDALLDIHRKSGLIRFEGDAFLVTDAIRVAGAQAAPAALEAHRQDVIARYPDSEAYVALLETCTAALPAVLTGKRSGVDVLFPGGSMAQVERIYKGNRRSDHFNALVAGAVSAMASARRDAGDDGTIAILEIGAGTGGTSASVLEALQRGSGRVTYDYTDISVGFIRHGERVYGARYPFASFKTLDIGSDIEPQGFAVGSHDLILATNVLHATKDIRATLRRAKRLLKANGLLVVNEVTEVRDFVTLTFGLTSGWWLFDDGAHRLRHAPLLSVAQWRAAMEDVGLREMRSFGLHGADEAGGGQHVMISESDGWLDAAELARGPARFAPAVTRAIPVAHATRPQEAAGARAAASPPRQPAPRVDGGARGRAVDYLRDVIAGTLKMDPADLEPRAALDKYGVDSLVAMDVIAKLEGDLGALPRTLLFEQTTVERLAEHLLDNYGEPLAARLGVAVHAASAEGPAEGQAASAGARGLPSVPSAPPGPEVRLEERRLRGGAPAPDHEPIAIVGLSGRYPGAPDLDAFWENLKGGVRAFSEIPPERWDDRDYYDPSGGRPGTYYHRWGAFLDEVDRFDPLLFGISPREAERMDPQERLFLEAVWTALEDAGYTGSTLNAAARRGGGSSVGVFVGVMYGPYQLLAADAWARGNRVEAHSAYWSIANRASYVFDFHGPSMAVDTACSSALTAVHLACESIRSGACRAAIAGGVNLILHPGHHVGLSRAQMLSREGRCRAFGQGADGFVPGEGVGAVVLKPLADAVQDGDHVYAVILGSSVNASGKTSGYMVPSAAAQADVIEATLRSAQIDPRSITYLEAQAVGSELADSIEVEGLTTAFARFTTDLGFCAIGSLKPNIGHLESASGMAQLTKVLLQLKHRQLAPSLDCEAVSPKIDFSRSPFYVQRHLGAWQAAGPEALRRAAISSFGAGGANAHLVVGEHVESAAEAARAAGDGAPQIVVLSARKAAQLEAYARRLRDYLVRSRAGGPLRGGALSDMAYTLQVGRQPLASRLAVVASDVGAVVDALGDFLERRARPDVYTGKAPRNEEGGLARAPIAVALDEGGLRRAAAAWVDGAGIDWELLHAGRARRRVPLPTYPFARERCWFDLLPRETAQPPSPSPSGVDVTTVPPGEPLRAPASVNGGGAAPEGRAMHMNGKASAPEAPRASGEVPRGALLDAVEAAVIAIAAEILKVDPAEIGPGDPMSDFGFDSLSLIEFTTRLNREYGITQSPAALYGHPSIGAFAASLAAEHRDAFARVLRPIEAKEARASGGVPAASPPPTPREQRRPAVVTSSERAVDDPIAIIGMSVRLPGSPDADAFWDNLVQGRDLVSEIPKDRFDWTAFYGDPRVDPSRISSRWAGIIDDIDKFDPAFFNISPREARLMDPQQRLFLEIAWKTIEDAGYRPSQLAGTRTGLFVGVAGTEYAQLLAQSGLEIDGQAATGTAHSILVNRISFLLDLHGPSEPVDTACSSSLVAVHRAVQSIRDGDCDMAIVGGVNVLLTPAGFLAFGRSGMLASDGKCKTFDERADGYVRGEGAGAVFLKPLSRALADRDRVVAVIRGTAINHGGRATSLTAPNPNAHADLLIRAYRRAGVDPATVGYIEAHGTGTSLGDPIEVNGLKKAFQALGSPEATTTPRAPTCGLGSVKANIGHLETAAGVAGLVKLVLAMQHRTLPPLVHFEKLNGYIDLDQTPFYIVDKATAWQAPRDSEGRELPRRAGVSSFGFGGVNVHVVLEDGPEDLSSTSAGSDDQPEIFVFSARNAERLTAYVQAFVAFLERLDQAGEGAAGRRSARLADIAYTLQVGREPMDTRLSVVASGWRDLLQKLRGFAAGQPGSAEVFQGSAEPHRELVGLFREEADVQTYLREIARKGNLRKLAALWAKGLEIDWDAVLEHTGRRRASVPSYPFARERCWLPVRRGEAEPAARAPADVRAPAPVVRAPAPVPPPRAPSRPAPAPSVSMAVPAPGLPSSPAAPAARLEGNDVAARGTNGASPHAGHDVARRPAPDAQAVTASLRRIFADFLEIDAASMEEDRAFTSYGVDSIAGLRIMQRVQQLLGDDVPMLAIIEHPSLRQLVGYLVENHVREGQLLEPAQNGRSDPSPPPSEVAPAAAVTPAPAPAPAAPVEARIIPFRAEGELAPMFCIYGDAGDLSWAIHLAEHLGHEHPVFGLEAPAFESGSPAATTVEEMAAACTRALVRASAAGPYRLAGCGIGAAIAFEVARELVGLGKRVEQLVLVDPPEHGDAWAERAAARAGEPAFALTLIGNLLGRVWGAEGPLRHDGMPRDREACLALAARWLSGCAAAPMAHDRLVRWIDQSELHLGAHARALVRYRPSPIPGEVPALLVQPSTDPLAPGNAYGLPELAPRSAERAAGWRSMLAPPPEVLEIEGDSLSITSAGSMVRLAERLARRPEDASGRALDPRRSERGSSRPGSAAQEPGVIGEAASAPLGSHGGSPFLVPINKNGSMSPSFWVHTLLGDVSYGLSLSHHLGVSCPVYGLEQFDVNGDVRLLPTIEKMAALYIDAMHEAQPKGPYHLGGYSFGGVVAFEMARQLMEAGERVASLILIDSLMPGTKVFNAIDTSAIVTDDFEIMALLLIGNTFCTRWHAERYVQIEDISGRSRDWQIDHVARHLHTHARAGRPLDEIELLVRRNYETITANNKALNSYVPSRLPGPVTTLLFHATLGFIGPNNPNNLPEVKILIHDRSNGFDQFIPDGLQSIDVPADHYTICREEFIQGVAQRAKVLVSEGRRGGPARPGRTRFGSAVPRTLPRPAHG